MRKVLLAPALIAALSVGGCYTPNERAAGGAVLGGAAGAALGAAATGRAGGALAGAALGAGTGAIVGAATAPTYAPPPRTVVVERVRERPVVVEEEVVTPGCRTIEERVTNDYGDVTVRRRRVCR